MRHTRLYALCLCCILLLSGCGMAEEGTEILEYGTLEYIEPTMPTKVSIDSSAVNILSLVDLPEYTEVSTPDDVDLEEVSDMSVHEGDEVTVKISYLQFTTEQTFIIGEDLVSAGFDEELIGLEIGDEAEFALTITDPQLSVFKNHEGETLSLLVEIEETDREDRYEDVLEQLWEEFASLATVKAIYTEYDELYEDGEDAEEAMIAMAAAYREGIDETSEEFLTLFEEDYPENSTSEFVPVIETYKDIIAQKICDTLEV